MNHSDNRKNCLNDFFAGPFDICERLVGTLQYCSFCSTEENDEVQSMEEIGAHFEKGSLYKGMNGLKGNESLIDKIQFLREKFSEFDERSVIVACEVCPQ